MTDIPEDILEAAKEALKAARPAYDSQEQYDQHWLAVSQALLSERMKERARCAKIAETHTKWVPWTTSHDEIYYRCNEGARIASAIRSGE